MKFFGRFLPRVNWERRIKKNESRIKKIELAIERFSLRLILEDLPDDRFNLIISRIEELEKIDKKANFFNLDSDDIDQNVYKGWENYSGYVSSDKYFSLINDDRLYSMAPISIISKLIVNAHEENLLQKFMDLRDKYGYDFLEYIFKQDDPLEIISNISPYLGEYDKMQRIFKDYVSRHPDEDNSQFYNNFIIINSVTLFQATRAKSNIKTGEDILDLQDFIRTNHDDSSFFSKSGKANLNSICSYLYGNSYKSIDNIINKYGADLEYFKQADSETISRIIDLNPQYYQRIIALYPTIAMLGLSDAEISKIDEQRIEELTKTQQIFTQIKDMKDAISVITDDTRSQAEIIRFIKDKAKTQNHINYLDFQKDIISCFENEYNRELFDPKRDAIRLNELSDVLGAEIYEIDYDNLDIFNVLARIEGQYHLSERVKKRRRAF